MATKVDYGRKWSDPAPEISPHPAPEVTRRPAAPEEIPRGAHLVYRKAEAAGWLVTATYARGTAMDRHGHAGALVHSLAVRMRLERDGIEYRAVAVWMAPAELSPSAAKWTSDSAYVWAVDHGALREVPLNPGRKDPAALSLAAYLLDPARLTDSSTVC
jgi:hypothetical protein